MRYKTYLILFFLIVAGPLTAFSQIDPSLHGSCEMGDAEAFLDVGNVRARLFNSGNLFWRGAPAVYEVPKGSGINATFADVLLLGGMIDGELRFSGSSYGPFEFWPGPIPKDGSPPEDCAAFDEIFTLDMETDLDPFDRGGPIPQSVLDWPVDLGAPYQELDKFPGYTPETGDRPYMRGDQMHWWVMNDLGNEHLHSGANPLGVEVRVTAFAFDTDNDLGNVTFYRYEITNRNASPIHEAYIGRFADVDLGNFDDDYMGSDSTLSLLYFYNADDDDEGGGGYGAAPPAFGYTIIEATHSRGGLPTDIGAEPGAFMTTIAGPDKGGRYGGHFDAMEHYLQMKGFWNTGERMTLGNLGRDPEASPTNYIYSGDPVTGSFWTQINSDGQGTAIAPSDKRMIGSFGPFDLEPGDTASFTFAYVWARGEDHLDSVTRLKAITAELHNASELLLKPRRPSSPQFIDANPPPRPQFPFWMAAPYPNPTTGSATFEYSVTFDSRIEIKLFDMLSREVALIESGSVVSGRHFSTFDTSSLAPGVYQIRLEQLRRVVSRILVVI